MSSVLAKAQMRGMMAKCVLFHIIGAFIVAIQVTSFYKFGVAERRKKTCKFLKKL